MTRAEQALCLLAALLMIAPGLLPTLLGLALATPMLPDGPPVVGASGKAGIWLNLGHGSSGWALSCGSARLIADQIAGQSASIDAEGLGLTRLGR